MLPVDLIGRLFFISIGIGVNVWHITVKKNMRPQLFLRAVRGSCARKRENFADESIFKV